MLAHFVDRDNVRMVQVGSGFGFKAKALNEGGFGKPTVQQHLEGYYAVDGQLAGPVNHAHSPAADLAQQLVSAEEHWQTPFA